MTASTSTLSKAFDDLNEMVGAGPATGSSSSHSCRMRGLAKEEDPTFTIVEIQKTGDLNASFRRLLEALRVLRLTPGPPAGGELVDLIGSLRLSGLGKSSFFLEVLSLNTRDALLRETETDQDAVQEIAVHARLARELRDATGLSAADLGAALNVSREQYQRWLSGSPISDPRHGFLIYLHTVAAEGIRVLGAEDFRVWLRTPRYGYPEPRELIRTRRVDEVHALISALAQSVPSKHGDQAPLLWQDDEVTDDDD